MQTHTHISLAGALTTPLPTEATLRALTQSGLSHVVKTPSNFTIGTLQAEVACGFSLIRADTLMPSGAFQEPFESSIVVSATLFPYFKTTGGSTNFTPSIALLAEFGPQYVDAAGAAQWGSYATTVPNGGAVTSAYTAEVGAANASPISAVVTLQGMGSILRIGYAASVSPASAYTDDMAWYVFLRVVADDACPLALMPVYGALPGENTVELSPPLAPAIRAYILTHTPESP